MRMISNGVALSPLKPSIGPFFLPEKYSLTPCSLKVTLTMIEIRKTENFAKWIDGLSDKRARARIFVRIERLATSNPGDVKPVGAGASELRINYGLGYRVYYKKIGRSLVVLLTGGDKRNQNEDIKNYTTLSKDL